MQEEGLRLIPGHPVKVSSFISQTSMETIEGHSLDNLEMSRKCLQYPVLNLNLIENTLK